MLISCKTILLILVGVLFLIAGCATLPSEPPPQSRPVPPVSSPPPQPSEPKAAKTPVPSPPPQPTEPKTTGTPGPRTIASLRLTEQARTLIESKEPDQAIRIIEKAIAIDSTNGYNYYYLAEAWLLKGDRNQAREFNRLAGIYLEKKSDWFLKVKRQKERIR